MRFEVFHPGRIIDPSDRAPAEHAAKIAERHVPSPDDLRLNIWTDGSPAKHTVGGVGICYGKWLPTQRDGLTKSHSFVVPRVRDANECEMVALADALLVVFDEIKENATTLRANNWTVRVMIWSDSHTALKYLQNPDKFRQFGIGLPAKVRALIGQFVSEIGSLPVKGPIEFHWTPGLCTTMHQTADFMTKNPLVKSGRGPISRTMKLLFQKRAHAPRPVAPPALPSGSGAKLSKSDREEVEKKGHCIEETKLKHPSEIYGDGETNGLKRCAPADIDIGNDRPEKTVRRNEGVEDGISGSKYTTHMSRSAPTSPEALTAPNAPCSTKPQTSSVQSLPDCAKPTASTVHASKHDDIYFVAVYKNIEHSRERDSLDTIWNQVETMEEAQKDMIERAMEEQLRENQKPFDPALFFLRMCPGSNDEMLGPGFPNTLSIIEDAVSKLSDPIRTNMQNAIVQQHVDNRIWGAQQAIIQCLGPQKTAE